MSYLIENPWPATYLFGTLALICAILLKATQQGKYLIGAAGAALAVGLIWGLDAAVTTDAERVEAAVHGLARAVRDAHPPRPERPLGSPGESPGSRPPAPPVDQEALKAGVDRAMAFLAPDAAIETNGKSLGPLLTRTTLRTFLENTAFDFLRVEDLEVDVAQQARLAKARFRVFAGGTHQDHYNFLTDAGGTAWDLGFREEGPGVWKVTRITPTRLPGEAKFLGLSVP